MRFQYLVVLLVIIGITSVQADVIVGPNVSIGSNVTVNSNRIKVNNTTTNEDGVSVRANAGYTGGPNGKTTYTCTAKNPNVTIKGNNLSVTIKGNCNAISINGMNNSVVAQQTLQLIESGTNNTISITRVREVYSNGENTSLTYSSGL